LAAVKNNHEYRYKQVRLGLYLFFPSLKLEPVDQNKLAVFFTIPKPADILLLPLLLRTSITSNTAKGNKQQATRTRKMKEVRAAPFP